MAAYYNEIDPFAAQWLRNLISAGHIASGEVDERSIIDVRSDDLKGFTQCHFFAGIAGWSYALRLARWPDSRPVWTGSCPCQPFSVAGKKKAQSDERHLWPHWFRLIRESKPTTIFGEQVEDGIATGWWDDVSSDMEKENYACAACVLPAYSVTAPHGRDRIFLWQTLTATSISTRSKESMEARSQWREKIGRKTITPGCLAEQLKWNQNHPIQTIPLLPTLTTSDAKGASAKRFCGSKESHGNLREVLRTSTGDGQYIHPNFAAWMMGFSMEHLKSAPTATQSFRKSQQNLLKQ